MRIAKLNNDHSPAFQHYIITNAGREAAKKITNPQVKRALVQFIEDMKPMKHVGVKLYANTYGEADLLLDIPDTSHYIGRFITDTNYNLDYRGIHVSDIDLFTSDSSYFINLNGQPGDENKMRALWQYFKTGAEPGIIGKINYFRRLANAVESARKDMEMSTSLNTKIDNL